MPQMMPMNWMYLYMVFSMSMILLIIMNFYMIKNQSNNYTSIMSKKYLTWKW